MTRHNGCDFKIYFLVLCQAFIFSSCARTQQNHISYIELPGAPFLQTIPQNQKLSGKLVVERFRDYRGLENEAPPRSDDCSEADFKTVLFPVHNVECKQERIGAFKARNSSSIEQTIIDGIPLAIAEDFEKRKLFDQVEFVKEPREEYPEASWRLVGLIVKEDVTFVYKGYYLPIINSYLFLFGFPRIQIINDVEIEFKLEDLKNKKTFIQKRYHKLETSQGFNLYQIDFGINKRDVGAYAFSQTIKIIVEDFVQDILNKGNNT